MKGNDRRPTIIFIQYGQYSILLFSALSYDWWTIRIVEIFPPYNFIAPGSCSYDNFYNNIVLYFNNIVSNYCPTGGLQQPHGYRNPGQCIVFFEPRRFHITGHSEGFRSKYLIDSPITFGHTWTCCTSAAGERSALYSFRACPLDCSDSYSLQTPTVCNVYAILLEITFKVVFNRYHT